MDYKAVYERWLAMIEAKDDIVGKDELLDELRSMNEEAVEDALPREKTVFDYKMNVDQRGSFTELIRTLDHGQVSINISKTGITKGQHWHQSKWEIFIVVHGHGLIQMRNLKDGEIEEYEVFGDKIQGVYMKPGWTHNIINLSETDDLVTVMFASELLDKDHPDTFFEPVVPSKDD